MLEVLELAVNYRGVQGLDKVSFRVEPGTLVGILGPNGAGKSTLFKAMLGLIPTVSGTVNYEGKPLQQQLKKVAYVPQRYSFGVASAIANRLGLSDYRSKCGDDGTNPHPWVVSLSGSSG